MTTLTDRVLDHVKAHQPSTSVQIAEAIGATRKGVAGRIQDLKRQGRLHTVNITTHLVHYYTDKALADAARPRAEHVTIRDMIRAELKRVGLVESREVVARYDLAMPIVGNQISQLVKRGELWPARRGHRDTVYFDTEKKAAAAVRAYEQARLKAAVTKPVPTRGAGFAPGTPVTYLPGYKHTVCPGFTPPLQGVQLPFAMGSQRGRA